MSEPGSEGAIRRAGIDRPGGRRAAIPREHRSPHSPTSPLAQNRTNVTEESFQFGQRLRDVPQPGERIRTQTLKQGRLVRVGSLDLETDAQTQFDMASPLRTVVLTHTRDKGSIRKDPQHGDVLWRLASIRTSQDERLTNRSVWIGWTRDERGRFTQPLMHPDAKRENPTLGLVE